MPSRALGLKWAVTIYVVLPIVLTMGEGEIYDLAGLYCGLLVIGGLLSGFGWIVKWMVQGLVA